MSENIQTNQQPVNQAPVQGPTKKCKHCQSDIPKKAKVCPVCRKKQGGKLKWIIIIIIALFIIGSIGGKKSDDSTTQESSSTSTSTESTSSPAKEVTGLTEEKYDSIQTGMTYDEVVAIIGEDGENIFETEIGCVKTVIYKWEASESWGNATITFSDGKVVNKAQFGVSSGDNVEITIEQYNSVETGMTYDEVVALFGGEGSLLSESDVAGYTAKIYMWEGSSLGANANITFSDGKVVAKAQTGLK